MEQPVAIDETKLNIAKAIMDKLFEVLQRPTIFDERTMFMYTLLAMECCFKVYPMSENSMKVLGVLVQLLQ